MDWRSQEKIRKCSNCVSVAYVRWHFNGQRSRCAKATKTNLERWPNARLAKTVVAAIQLFLHQKKERIRSKSVRRQFLSGEWSCMFAFNKINAVASICILWSNKLMCTSTMRARVHKVHECWMPWHSKSMTDNIERVEHPKWPAKPIKFMFLSFLCVAARILAQVLLLRSLNSLGENCENWKCVGVWDGGGWRRECVPMELKR